MTDYVRTQILLEKEQRQALNEIAEQSGVTFSELVRNFLAAQIRLHTYAEMEHAAKLLYEDYASDNELTILTDLDTEDFSNEEG